MDDDDPLRSVMFAGFIVALYVWTIAGIFLSGILQWLWDALLSPLFHWPYIDYVHAWILYMALSILVLVIKLVIKVISNAKRPS